MTIRQPNNSYVILAGNGTQTAFSFPFASDRFEDDDVFVYLWNSSSKEWDKKTVTTHYTLGSNTVTFGSAPATPVAGVSGNILIVRKTDVDEDHPQADFQPGSSIRAQDLDNNQLQALRSIKELRDGTLSRFVEVDESTGATSNPKMYANLDMTGRNIETLGKATVDSEAVNREQLGDVIATDITGNTTQGVVLNKSTGGSNSGDQMEISIANSSPTQKGSVIIETSNNAAMSLSYNNGTATLGVNQSSATQQGVVRVQASSPVTATYTSPGELDLSIIDGSIDLQKFKPDDVRTLVEQNANPNVVGSDDEIGTTAANDKRYDVIYQSGTPSGTDFPTGKLWYDHAADQTLSVWSGTNWLGISSGGTFVTQPTVIWVDSVNGLDTNDGHRVIDAMKTIKAAVASADHGDIILVAPGVYREIAPIDITVNNLSIVGQSLRSCFIHPTPSTEQNTLFRVNSGTQIQNFSICGLKASGTRGGHPIDSDSTYGLPTNQAFVAEFYPNSVIYKSPYIQNCTNFADSGIPNHTEAEYNANNSLGGFFDPNNVNQGGFGGDLTSAPTGGGLLVDGAAVSTSSPLRSMVVDSFTQITMDGPGILCCNNGYAQLVSFFGTFCHYHAKALNGGQLNLSNCTTDYGRYGLIADGKSTTAIFSGQVTAAASTGALFFTVGAQTAGAAWHGSATRPQDNMLVTVGPNTYPVKSATANGSGWDVYIENPDPQALSNNLGLAAAIASGASVSFFYRSYISTGGHTFEYVGSGTDYRADPANGGVPVEANQVKSLNNGKVWQSSTDHNGKFKVGDTFSVNQRSGEVFISLDAYRPEVVNDLTPQLGGDLDVNGKDITGTVKLNGLTYPSSDGATDQVLKTDGSGNLSFIGISQLQSAGMQNVSDDTTPQLGGQLDAQSNKIVSLADPTAAQDAATKNYVDTNSNIVNDTSPQLGGNLDVNGQDIVSTSNGDIDLDPNGSGQVVFKGNATRGSGGVKLNCENNSHGIVLKGPPHSAGANYTMTLPNNTGTNGQVLETNGSGVTSWVDLPPPAGTIQATASGALADGDLVAINTNGTVSTIAQTTVAASASGKTNVSFDCEHPCIIYFSREDKYLVVGADRGNNGKATAVVMTVAANGTVTYGTKTVFDSNNNCNHFKLAYNGSNVACIMYMRSSSIYAVGCEVTGTSMSFGNIMTVESGSSTQNFCLHFHAQSGNEFFVTHYGTSNISSYYFTRTFTPGTTGPGLTASSQGNLTSNATQSSEVAAIGSCYCPSMNKSVVFWYQQNNDYVFYSTFNSHASYDSSRTYLSNSIAENKKYIQCIFDEDKNQIVVITGGPSATTRRVRIGTPLSSNTEFSWGTTYGDFNGDTHKNMDNRLVYNPATSNCYVVYQYGAKIKAREITPSGTGTSASPTIGSEASITPSTSFGYYPTCSVDSTANNRIVNLYRAWDDPGFANERSESVTYTPSYLTSNSDKYIGISDAAYANGVTATIQTVGSTDDAQSGLTAGSTYYVTPTGTLSTTAGSPSVVAGTAISASKLIIKG